MRLCRAGMRPFALPLVQPLETAHGRIEWRSGWLLWLEDAEGCVGFGEATPLPSFGSERPGECEAALAAGLEALVSGSDGASPSLEAQLELIEGLCAATPCALAGLDVALHDGAARRASLPLASWLRRRAGLEGAAAETLAVQALVAGGTPEAVAAAARDARAAGFATLKLKLGVSAHDRGLDRSGERVLAGDLDRVAALREGAGSQAKLRLDANEAWTRAEAEEALAVLARFDIDYVEQPVARDDVAGLAALAAEAPIAVAADEALLGRGLELCLEQSAARIFVVKPAALGGITPATRLVERARALGIRLVWSTLLDGAVSRSAAWHLAAGLGPRDETHGLATASWLGRDLWPTPGAREGRLAGPQGPGLGLDAAALQSGEGEPWRGPMRWVGGRR